jgi:hypothetical protein
MKKNLLKAMSIFTLVLIISSCSKKVASTNTNLIETNTEIKTEKLTRKCICTIKNGRRNNSFGQSLYYCDPAQKICAIIVSPANAHIQDTGNGEITYLSTTIDSKIELILPSQNGEQEETIYANSVSEKAVANGTEISYKK